MSWVSWAVSTICRRSEVTAATYLHTDDTPVTVLDDRGGSFKGRLWTYLDPLGRQVVFDATATHERAGPEAFLATFQGALHADAYAGYDALYRSGRVREIGCWAHARRRFVEALMTDPQAARIVALVQQLYDIERAAADLDVEARRARRQEQFVPLLARIEAVRQDLARTVLPKSPLGDALRYLTNQWPALQRYVHERERGQHADQQQQAAEQEPPAFGQGRRQRHGQQRHKGRGAGAERPCDTGGACQASH